MTHQKVKYILDFDRTLLDTDRMKKDQVDRFGEEKLGTRESLEGLDVSTYLFADAVSFLETHRNDDLSIVSSCRGFTGAWDIEYQKEKVALSGVAERVGAVSVVQDSKSDAIGRMVSKKDHAVFIDDMYAHLKEVKLAFPNIHIVQIVREEAEHVEDAQDIADCIRIHELGELDAELGIERS